MLNRPKKWLLKITQNKKLKALSETVMLLAASYLMIKKLTDFSISGWLLTNALQQPLVNGYVWISLTLLIASILFKLVSMHFEYFPSSKHAFVEPDEISDCLYRINQEISSHLTLSHPSQKKEKAEIKSVCNQHQQQVNLGFIVDSLAEHIRKSISGIKVKKRNLFISLYCYDNVNSSLDYVLHFDPKRDLVESTHIALDDEKFSRYESVKCMKSNKAIVYVLDAKEDYAKGGSKRHKSIRHYLGCKLLCGDHLFGFLNIEFHHETVFLDEDEMLSFMEEHIYPFKLLIEYQFLKGKFFSSFKEFEDHWRAA